MKNLFAFLHLDYIDLIFIKSFVAAGTVAVACSLLGVFIVLRRIIFIGDGISHASFTGIALGVIFGVNPTLSGALFCGVIGCIIPIMQQKKILKEDISTGVIFPAAISLGVILISISESPTNQVVSYLFGSILTVSDYNILLSLIVSVITILFIVVFNKELIGLVFDEENSALNGIPIRILTLFLFFLISIVIAFSIKIVGIILISGLLVTPAATALRFARSFNQALLLSVILGFISAEIGLCIAFVWDLPPGATICLFSTALFALSLFLKK